MKLTRDPVQRLLEAVSTDETGDVIAVPAGFERRVLDQWRTWRLKNDPRWIVPLARRAFCVAGILMALSLAYGSRQWRESGPQAPELAWADGALKRSLLP